MGPKGGGVLYLEGLPGPKLAESGGSEQGLSARSHKTEEAEEGNGLTTEFGQIP